MLYPNPQVLFPKNIEGVAYVDTFNSQGWAGSDVGAWINSAYAYLKTTYGTTFGGIIHIAPGTYSFSTSISIALTGFTIILEGSGDGNGGTQFVYTGSGVALTLGGGSGNNGGGHLKDFTLNGPGIGSAATGIFLGVNGTASLAGGSIENVALNNFGTGIDQLTNGQVYAIQFRNVKVQTCTNGYKPAQENNVWIGGLLGGCTTGINMANAVELQMYGTAFDDCTTNAMNIANALARVTLLGCRFENPTVANTSNYIAISAGSLNMHGGGFQEDNGVGGSNVATGFIQASGGNVAVNDTWLFSNGRVLPQAFNVSGTALLHADPMIATSSSGITTLFTPGYAGAPKRLDWSRIYNANTAQQSVAVVAATALYLTSSNLNIPNPLAGGIVAGTSFEWEICLSKSAAGTGNFTITIFAGTNGSVSDTALATQAVTQTGVVDTATLKIKLTVIGGGATGTAFWSITARHNAAAAAGFGFANGAGQETQFSGTTGAFNFTTAGLKFGIGVTSAVATPTITVPLVRGQAYNVD